MDTSWTDICRIGVLPHPIATPGQHVVNFSARSPVGSLLAIQDGHPACTEPQYLSPALKSENRTHPRALLTERLFHPDSGKMHHRTRVCRTEGEEAQETSSRDTTMRCVCHQIPGRLVTRLDSRVVIGYPLWKAFPGRSLPNAADPGRACTTSLVVDPRAQTRRMHRYFTGFSFCTAFRLVQNIDPSVVIQRAGPKYREPSQFKSVNLNHVFDHEQEKSTFIYIQYSDVAKVTPRVSYKNWVHSDL